MAHDDPSFGHNPYIIYLYGDGSFHWNWGFFNSIIILTMEVGIGKPIHLMLSIYCIIYFINTFFSNEFFSLSFVRRVL